MLLQVPQLTLSECVHLRKQQAGRNVLAGIRIPDSPFIIGLCRAFGGAIALTSANLSGGSSSLEVEGFRELWPRCGAIYDSGRIDASPAGSTIIDLSSPGSFKILRPGVVELETKAVLERHGIAQRQ